jgi:hypothetical protein
MTVWTYRPPVADRLYLTTQVLDEIRSWSALPFVDA